LGLDGKDAVDRYRYEMAGRRKKPVLSMPQPMTEGRAPSALILVAASLAVLMIYAMWYGVSSANRAEVTVAPPLPSAVQASPSTSDSLVPPNTDSTAISQATPTPVPSSPLSADASVTSSGITSTGIPVSGTPPQPSLSKDSQKMVPAADPLVKTAKDIKNQLPSVVPGTPELVIRATQSSWVMITDDNGKAVYDHVLKPGETYKVPHQAGLSLTTGNGSGIILSLNGIDLPKIAAGSPHVVRNVPLDADKLSALKAE
jgi:cytoskeleton protein RodZ